MIYTYDSKWSGTLCFDWPQRWDNPFHHNLASEQCRTGSWSWFPLRTSGGNLTRQSRMPIAHPQLK